MTEQHDVGDERVPHLKDAAEADAWTNAAATVIGALLVTGHVQGATAAACEIADQVIAQRRERLNGRPKPEPTPVRLGPLGSFGWEP